ncbi:MAG TPA: DUF433 domain-containing protein [Candidatus Eisenbacteria bacterium]
MEFPADRLAALISRRADTMSGMPVFVGTRVPIQNLLDYLEDDDMAGFLDNFPSVRQEHAEELARLARGGVNVLEDPAGRVRTETAED